MTVPEGFRVEIVASEPDLVNPVAMTFDERGRIWVTESLEYPRKEPGPGRDRIKVIEDTDGDGKADRFSIFAEGLNIPSGIAVGHGGVWVANSPDILFLQDTDGDGKADRREVIVTGFGRFDTHELPNSLTWGPDGWLYGWNGVFNRSVINYRGKTHDFTCAIFRIHPRTRDFEVFCEGTSNPWGIAWDPEGSAFASACVIDHLWHLTETGYYHRQGGPYPPFTWKIESIVGHRHQQAAYCGIHYFDSEAYPPEFRGRLYMGNIHGNGINVDVLSRRGSTYQGDPGPDFLSANDAWFMPVAQKTGPDGCLYVLDWYDRYHCYQDARRDPAGIDRLKGRLYRVRYHDTPRRAGFDLSKEDDGRLIALLGSPNVYDRDIAQRLLVERNTPALRTALEAAVLDSSRSRKARMHALWARVSCGPLGEEFHQALLKHDDSGFRAWGVRAAGNAHTVADPVRSRVAAMAADPSPDVRLQVAVASRKIAGFEDMPALVGVLAGQKPDPLLPHIVWQNLHPLLEDQAERFVRLVDRGDLAKSPDLVALLPRAFDRLLACREPDPRSVASLLAVILRTAPTDPGGPASALQTLAARIQSGEIAGPRLAAVREALGESVRTLLSRPASDPLAFEAALLAASWGDPDGTAAVRRVFVERTEDPAKRMRAVDALVAAPRAGLLDTLATALSDRQATPAEIRGRILAALGRLDDARVARVVLEHYPAMEPELQPRAVEVLTQRPAWSLPLLRAIAAGKVAASALNVNQIRRLLGSNDPEIVRRAKTLWGSVREGRSPEREQVIAQMRRLLRGRHGDPQAGQRVFQKLCGQCHKIHGEGQDVGPDITVNGRGSYEQLLSNVFDPSLVIGAAYQATTVATTDGRVLTGLIVEDSPQRIVLKGQGGKLETIARSDVDEMKVSALSLMPEDLEKQLKPEEIVDLFSFITLDKPPTDPTARPIPGAGREAPAARAEQGARKQDRGSR
jgi:putative membrane-bound dehydrogenase-like protein